MLNASSMPICFKIKFYEDEFENSTRRLSFLCHVPDIIIVWINAWLWFWMLNKSKSLLLICFCCNFSKCLAMLHIPWRCKLNIFSFSFFFCFTEFCSMKFFLYVLRSIEPGLIRHRQGFLFFKNYRLFNALILSWCSEVKWGEINLFSNLKGKHSKPY